MLESRKSAQTTNLADDADIALQPQQNGLGRVIAFQVRDMDNSYYSNNSGFPLCG